MSIQQSTVFIIICR